MQNTNIESRAVVLGGGGVTGMAWEIGIITALLVENWWFLGGYLWLS